MRLETITDRAELLIRRLVLEPGEATVWHSDRCRRFTVVVRGTRLAIQYQDSAEELTCTVHPGLADWDEPEARVHRAVNRGDGPYEEVVTFYRSAATVEPQPGPAT